MTGRDGRKRKKHSTSLPKKYHKNALICTRSTGTFKAMVEKTPAGGRKTPAGGRKTPAGGVCFLAGETSVPTAGATEHVTIPRHMRAYIYRWCVCALNARQYATLPRLTPTERHVVMYDVWVFPAHPSLCAALPDLSSAVLSGR